MKKLALSLALAFIASPAFAWQASLITYVYQETRHAPKRYAIVEDTRGKLHRMSWQKASMLTPVGDALIGPVESLPQYEPEVTFPVAVKELI